MLEWFKVRPRTLELPGAPTLRSYRPAVTNPRPLKAACRWLMMMWSRIGNVEQFAILDASRRRPDVRRPESGRRVVELCAPGIVGFFLGVLCRRRRKHSIRAAGPCLSHFTTRKSAPLKGSIVLYRGTQPLPSSCSAPAAGSGGCGSSGLGFCSTLASITAARSPRRGLGPNPNRLTVLQRTQPRRIPRKSGSEFARARVLFAMSAPFLKHAAPAVLKAASSEGGRLPPVAPPERR